MSRKARLWIGTTLLTVLAINYIIIGVPLFGKAASIETRYKAAMTKQLKASGNIFKGSEDEYLVEIFRRERTAVARSLLILNTVSLSILVLIGSWTAFGLIFRRER
jgi:hypothetical protein